MPLLGALSLLNSFTEPLPPDPEEANYESAVMVFAQASSPNGWTKETSMDDFTLRVVTGNVSTGGDVGFSDVFTYHETSSTINTSSPSAVSGSTTLNANQVPSHAHSYSGMADRRYYNPTLGSGTRVRNRVNRSTSLQIGGGGQSHNHGASFISFSTSTFTETLDFRVKYVDIILATKD